MALFLLFYRSFLEKESIHLFKRFYLLGALVLSLVIPVIVFTEYVAPSNLTPVSGTSGNILGSPDISSTSATYEKINVPLLLWTIYGLGALLFGFRFFVHLHQILHNIRKKTKIKEGNITKVLMEKNLPPHTFFRYIFLNKEKYETRAIPQEVITHEKAHARQWHSLDILFVELLNVTLWFNPLLPWFKKNILLNHEFLADQAVLESATSIPKYQNILLSFLSKGSEYPSAAMANAINYSSTRAERSRSIKKRFTVMKTKTSKKSTLLRTLIVLPFVVLLVYGFSEKQIVERERLPITPDVPNVQEGASGEQIEEYNTLARKYNAMPKNRMPIVPEEVERLEYIYSILSDTQRADVESFPDFPEPPPGPKAPKRSNNISDVQYASNRIDSIINTQDPYDDVNGNMYLPLSAPTPVLPLTYVKEMGQEGASRAQMKEYNTLARKYNAMTKETFYIKGKEVERMKYLYSLMSDKQRQDAEPFPDFPEPPAPPMPPAPLNAMEVEKQIEAEEPIIENQDVMAKLQKMAQQKSEMEAQIQVMEEQHLALEKQAREMEIQHEKMQRKKAHLTEQDRLKIEEQARKLEAKHLEMEQKAKNMEQQAKEIEQKTLEIKRQHLKNPPPPPEPKSPLEHIREMEKKNAIFYHNGKEIPAEKAIDLLKNHKKIKLETSHEKGTRPEVRLFTKR